MITMIILLAKESAWEEKMTTLNDRVEILKTKHKDLEEQIKYASDHYQGDIRVNFLKKTKLKVKDEIVRLVTLIKGDKNKPFDKSKIKYRDGDNT